MHRKCSKREKPVISDRLTAKEIDEAYLTILKATQFHEFTVIVKRLAKLPSGKLISEKLVSVFYFRTVNTRITCINNIQYNSVQDAQRLC